MAGFEVLDIINEPTAAAIAFGFHQGFARGEGEKDESHRVMVYDLGGGTFDVTLMEIRGSHYVTLATDGDVQLGGYDWDQRLVDLVAQGFIRQHFCDPREDAIVAGRLWRECEDAKRTLSTRPKASVSCDYRGFSSRIEITREQFEEATQDLVDRTRFTMTQTLKAAGLQWSDVDRILLTGGSTRMPMVRAMVRQISGKEPDTSVAADEAVAHGAALRAGLLLDKARGKSPSFHIRNVNSHSLGVVGIDSATKRRRTGVLIPRNTPIPVTAKRVFKTQKTKQRSILVEVVEGENASPDDCTAIGRCTISKLPPSLPAGSPVEVQFHYAANGRLKVRVSVPDTTSEVENEFARENSLPKEHLDGWRRYISGLEPTSYQ
jgi:molecular chaperone DnaK